MRRIDNAEEAELKDRLTDWLTIRDAEQILDQYRDIAGFYCGSLGRLKDWREAYRATQFARLRSATQLKLVREYRPDFCLLIQNVSVSCELVEVIQPGQKRDWEFNNLARMANSGIQIPPENFDPGDLFDWLRESFKGNLRNKADKGYANDTILAMHVAGMVFPSMRAEVNSIIESEVKACSHGFKEVWVLIDGELQVF